MPTSRQSLVAHRAATAHEPAHRRVWFFHAHCYFDDADPARVAEATAFRDRIAQTLTAAKHVQVNTFIARPVGPHPRGNFEVLFTRDAFADVVTWLQFNRPDAISVLVHPITTVQVLDHTAHAIWLGPQLALDPTPLAAYDAKVIASGRSDEDAIDAVKQH